MTESIAREVERQLTSKGWPSSNAPQVEVERFLTPAEAAQVLRCSTTLLYQLLRRDEVPAIRMGAKRYAIPVRAVNLIVDVIMSSGSVIGIADWKNAWNEHVSKALSHQNSTQRYSRLEAAS